MPDLSMLDNDCSTADRLLTMPVEIYDTLNALKVGKASGLDNLSAELFRRCASGISSSLSVLFKRSFDKCGVFYCLEDCLGDPGPQR